MTDRETSRDDGGEAVAIADDSALVLQNGTIRKPSTVRPLYNVGRSIGLTMITRCGRVSRERPTHHGGIPIRYHRGDTV
jgi:hypothetical protein